ncbi:MAG: helix-turn-helix domain-containing protein [Sarcina sp.]
MKLDDLKYLCVIQETKSFTKTAEIFMVSQPIVSIAIKRLEEEVNEKVVFKEKFSGKIKLTQSGKNILEFYYKVNKEIDELKKEFEFDNNDLIYIGIKNKEVYLILRNYVANLYQKYSLLNKEIKFFQADDNVLNKALSCNKLQMKISISNECIQETFKLKKKLIKIIDFCIIKSYKNIDKIESISDLNNKTIIAIDKSLQTKKLYEILAENNINAKEIIFVKSLNLARILIEKNKGIGLFLCDVLRESKMLVKIKIDYKMYLCLEYNDKQTSNEFIDLFKLE